MKEFETRDDAMEAEDWKAMYMIMIHAAADAAESVAVNTKWEMMHILVDAMQKAEDYYINVSDAVLGRPERKKPLTEAVEHKKLG